MSARRIAMLLPKSFPKLFPTMLLLPILAAAARAGHAPLAPGEAAPAFALPGRSGAVALDSLKGHVVLLDFWASWCGPCRQSFPWMAAVQESLAARGLRVVAVNLDKERGPAEAFLARYPVPFAVAFDPGGATAERYGVRAMPTSVLVGRDGKVLLVHAGFDPRTAGAYERSIEEACRR